MKRIEETMLEAIKAGKAKCIDNTTVTSDGAVYLHGNKIAQYNKDDNTLRLDHCGWHTITTRSRLDALCELLDGNYRANIRGGILALTNTDTGERVALPATLKAAGILCGMYVA